MKVHEHGLQSRERSRVYPSKPTCAAGQNAESVRWRDCYAAAMLLGTGMVFSILTFCVEKLIKFKLTAELREKIRRSNCVSMSKLIDGMNDGTNNETSNGTNNETSNGTNNEANVEAETETNAESLNY